jgi:hypothetical protein
MNKHFVIHPDGTKSTRNSENRTYTHAIAVSPLSEAVAIEYFDKQYDMKTQEMFRYAEIIDEIEENGVTIKVVELFGSDHNEFYVGDVRIFIDGGYRQPGSITPEEAAGKALATYRRFTITANAELDRILGKINQIKKDGSYGKWEVITWCGRLDLAEKQYKKYGQRKGQTVQLVEVEVK